jgi:S-adenosylmethionine synthetase
MLLDGVERNTPWEMKDLVPILKEFSTDYLKKKGGQRDE